MVRLTFLKGVHCVLMQDNVEVQLLKEVAARSASFFQAASSLQHLRSVLGGALDQVKALRQQLGELDEQTYSAAVTVAELQHRRKNLVAVLTVTKVRVAEGP